MIDKMKNRTYEILEVAGPGDLFSGELTGQYSFSCCLIRVFNVSISGGRKPSWVISAFECGRVKTSCIIIFCIILIGSNGYLSFAHC